MCSHSTPSLPSRSLFLRSSSGIGHPSPHLPATRYGIGASGIQATDVGFTLRANPGRFDVVLLDTDNGPAAFTAAGNAGLYDNAGVAAAFAALRPSGTLAVWSAWDDRKFEQRLRFHGFLVEVARVRARLHKGGPRHSIFVAHKNLAVS